ncbi:MAG: AsmA-like C-terminal region-containing protein [Phycisphaeraceae bacterium]|nr:AsmA-like C-terminal region-containing protein [Phycisphaeraceae bacterium]
MNPSNANPELVADSVDVSADESAPTWGQRIRRWVRRLLITAILLVLLAVVALSWLLDAQRMAGFLEKALSNSTGATVLIDRAELTWTGRLTVQGLEMRVPDAPPGGDSLVKAPLAVVHHDLWGLITGGLPIRRIEMDRPVLYLTEYENTDYYTFQDLAPAGDPDEPDAAPELPQRVPEVNLNRGTVQFGRIVEGRYQRVDTMRLDGNVRSVFDHPGNYDFALRSDLASAGDPPSIRGRFDLHQESFSLQIEDFRFDSPQRNLLPTVLRQWWDRIEPAGTVSSLTMSVSGPDQPVTAGLVLNDVALSIKLGEYVARLHDVESHLTLKGKRLTVERLVGRVADEKTRYQLEGSFADITNPNGPFHVTVTANDLPLEAKPGYLPSLPLFLKRALKIYSPEGAIHSHLTLQREEPDGKVAYDGHVDLAGLDVTYWKFPYPLKDLRGRVALSSDRVEIQNVLAKSPDGGTVTISGTIEPPGFGAAVALKLAVADIPLNERLLDATKPKHRRIIERFLDQPAYQRLLEANLVRRPGEAADASSTESDAPPVFAPGGRLNGNVFVERPYGDDAQYSTRLDLDLAGTHLLLVDWPYPLTMTGGRLKIAGGRAIAEDVTGQGLDGSRVTVNGELALGDAAREQEDPPVMNVAAENLPVNERLYASLPHPQNEWLKELGLAGRFNATAAVTGRPDGSITFSVTPQLTDISARPFGGDLTLDRLTGALQLDANGARVRSIRGRSGDGTVTLTGNARWTGSTPALNLTFRGQGLSLTDPLIDLIPPHIPERAQVQALLNTYQPAGRLNLDVHYQQTAEDRRYRVVLHPKTLAVTVGDQRLNFTEMAGTATVHPGRVQLAGLQGKFGSAQTQGTFNIAGPLKIQDSQIVTAELNLNAAARAIDPTARTILPTVVTHTLNQLTFSGGYRLEEATFIYNRQAEGEAQRFQFGGNVSVVDGRVDLGIPLTNINGLLTVSARQAANATWPTLDLQLIAEDLKAERRPVGALATRVRTHPQKPSRLVINPISGRVADGQLIGDGWIDMARGGRYHLELTLQQARLQPILEPDHKLTAEERAAAALDAEKDEEQARGRLTANLTLEGTPGQPDKRSGRGRIEVDNARVYEVPGAMNALQLLNLSLPTSEAFDRVTTSFLVQGNRIRFDRIALTAPSVALIGGGTMELANRRLDLALISENPSALHLGPISDLLDNLRDELVTVRITGTLDEPKPKAVSFSTIRETWRKLFGPPDQDGDEPSRDDQ